MHRGRPKAKGQKVIYCAKKRSHPSKTLKVTAASMSSAHIDKNLAKMESMQDKAPRKMKEPILNIKPATYAQKRQNKLLELTQGNFYKKSYRKKACQNLEEDFLQVNYQSQLPLKKSLAKILAKQSIRTEKALNNGQLFKVNSMMSNENGIIVETKEQTNTNANLLSSTSFQVIERPEFNPNKQDKFYNLDALVQEQIQHNCIFPFESDDETQPKTVQKPTSKVRVAPIKQSLEQIKKEDRIWLIVKEQTKKIKPTVSDDKQNKITIFQSPVSKRALSIQQKQRLRAEKLLQSARGGRGRGIGRGRGRGRGGRVADLSQSPARPEVQQPSPVKIYSEKGKSKQKISSSKTTKEEAKQHKTPKKTMDIKPKVEKIGLKQSAKMEKQSKQIVINSPQKSKPVQQASQPAPEPSKVQAQPAVPQKPAPVKLEEEKKISNNAIARSNENNTSEPDNQYLKKCFMIEKMMPETFRMQKQNQEFKSPTDAPVQQSVAVATPAPATRPPATAVPAQATQMTLVAAQVAPPSTQIKPLEEPPQFIQNINNQTAAQPPQTTTSSQLSKSKLPSIISVLQSKPATSNSTNTDKNHTKTAGTGKQTQMQLQSSSNNTQNKTKDYGMMRMMQYMGGPQGAGHPPNMLKGDHDESRSAQAMRQWQAEQAEQVLKEVQVASMLASLPQQSPSINTTQTNTNSQLQKQTSLNSSEQQALAIQKQPQNSQTTQQTQMQSATVQSNVSQSAAMMIGQSQPTSSHQLQHQQLQQLQQLQQHTNQMNTKASAFNNHKEQNEIASIISDQASLYAARILQQTSHVQATSAAPSKLPSLKDCINTQNSGNTTVPKNAARGTQQQPSTLMPSQTQSNQLHQQKDSQKEEVALLSSMLGFSQSANPNQQSKLMQTSNGSKALTSSTVNQNNQQMTEAPKAVGVQHQFYQQPQTTVSSAQQQIQQEVRSANNPSANMNYVTAHLPHQAQVQASAAGRDQSYHLNGNGGGQQIAAQANGLQPSAAASEFHLPPLAKLNEINQKHQPQQIQYSTSVVTAHSQSNNLNQPQHLHSQQMVLQQSVQPTQAQSFNASLNGNDAYQSIHEKNKFQQNSGNNLKVINQPPKTPNQLPSIMHLMSQRATPKQTPRVSAAMPSANVASASMTNSAQAIGGALNKPAGINFEQKNITNNASAHHSNVQNQQNNTNIHHQQQASVPGTPTTSAAQHQMPILMADNNSSTAAVRPQTITTNDTQNNQNLQNGLSNNYYGAANSTQQAPNQTQNQNVNNGQGATTSTPQNAAQVQNLGTASIAANGSMNNNQAAKTSANADELQKLIYQQQLQQQQHQVLQNNKNNQETPTPSNTIIPQQQNLQNNQSSTAQNGRYQQSTPLPNQVTAGAGMFSGTTNTPVNKSAQHPSLQQQQQHLYQNNQTAQAVAENGSIRGAMNSHQQPTMVKQAPTKSINWNNGNIVSDQDQYRPLPALNQLYVKQQMASQQFHRPNLTPHVPQTPQTQPLQQLQQQQLFAQSQSQSQAMASVAQTPVMQATRNQNNSQLDQFLQSQHDFSGVVNANSVVNNANLLTQSAIMPQANVQDQQQFAQMAGNTNGYGNIIGTKQQVSNNDMQNNMRYY